MMRVSSVFLLISIIHSSPTTTLAILHSIGGSWCPYETESFVPCRVRNGSEFLMSPKPMCSKALHGNVNGSLNCVQRVLRRPRYVTILKKVIRTNYKCCPTFTGNNCQTECFNCASFKALESRVHTLERRLKGSEVKVNVKVPHTPSLIEEDENEVRVEEELEEGETSLERTIRRLLTNLRNLDYRLESVERRVGGWGEGSQKPTKRVAGPEYEMVGTVGSGSGSEEREEEEHVLRAFKMLEKDLARGDIASTLNDDYGEENGVPLGDDYVDELKGKEPSTSQPSVHPPIQ